MIKLGRSEQFAEGQSRGFAHKSRHFFVVRRDGLLYAYVNACPHLGIALEWQPDHFLDEDAELIQCHTHGALFIIETGVCVSGPCVGRQLTPCRVLECDGEVFLLDCGESLLDFGES